MPSVARKLAVSDVEDHLSTKDFERISSLVGEKVGIRLSSGKRLMTEGRLRKRRRAVGLDSLDEYCQWLFERDGLEQELPHLIDAVTTNKTDFFREREHYDYLESVIVPDLLKHRRDRLPLIKVWSAASSNGAEAFSAAMILENLVRDGGRFRYAILGTDISNEVLEQGRRAVYSAELVAPVPEIMQSRYVMRARKPGARPEIRIAPELRRKVVFRYLNLMDVHYAVDRDVDVIFLRNVLIYFERPVQAVVIGRLVSHLRPGGYLLLGHSESMIGNGFPLTQVAAATFRKN